VSDGSQILVVMDVAPERAEDLARDVRRWLVAEGVIEPAAGGGEHAPGPRRRAAIEGEAPDAAWSFEPNTVSLRVGRQVFDAGGNGVEVRCDACGEAYEPGEGWIDAVGAWAGGEDAASYACERCGAAAPLAAWRGPWPWGFGSLGVEFWNWPPLSEAFVEGLGQHLGHDLVLVRRRV
jgi:hypothetical protein